MQHQKALPAMTAGGGPRAPNLTGSDRLNLSRFRSTPWGRRTPRAGAMVRAISPAPAVSMCPGARLPGGTLKRPSPNSTPPYRLAVLALTPFCASTMAPSFTRSSECVRSFQSWGTSRQQPSAASLTADQSARSNHRSSSFTCASRRNFARMEALAASRRWWTTLFLSATSSKLWVKSSAYLTMGWSGLVTGASVTPLSFFSCSLASTPISTRGIRMLSSVT
mmetsp:Transcript_110198/g.329459  ORF Transcript_110198/g.329459 Transcript_110198/m.329459 type:complete len:222 (-) Transcript_110198:119-784(-)